MAPTNKWGGSWLEREIADWRHYSEHNRQLLNNVNQRYNEVTPRKEHYLYDYCMRSLWSCEVRHLTELVSLLQTELFDCSSTKEPCLQCTLGNIQTVWFDYSMFNIVFQLLSLSGTFSISTTCEETAERRCCSLCLSWTSSLFRAAVCPQGPLL